MMLSNIIIDNAEELSIYLDLSLKNKPTASCAAKLVKQNGFNKNNVVVTSYEGSDVYDLLQATYLTSNMRNLDVKITTDSYVLKYVAKNLIEHGIDAAWLVENMTGVRHGALSMDPVIRKFVTLMGMNVLIFGRDLVSAFSDITYQEDGRGNLRVVSTPYIGKQISSIFAVGMLES